MLSSQKIILQYALFSLMCGCATLPKDFPATVSTAISQTELNTLRKMVEPEVTAHPDKSGFYVLNNGRQAFMARLALAETAERTIDCQYFIWHGDASGNILIQRLLKAANRGVRVRLLLDDMTTHGKDLGLAALNLHPNIEIRIFNPLGRRYYFGLFRVMSLAFHAGRMTNRMHNKIFAVDNQVAILGGRNIGDEYFGLNPKSNFRDLDLFSMGPIVNDISHAFDDYWNSPWSVPFEVYKTRLPSKKKQEKFLQKLQENFEEMERTFPYPLDLNKDSILGTLSSLKKDVVWSRADVVADSPGKAWEKAESGASKSEIINTLDQVGKNSQNEILVVSPYFIVADKSIRDFGRRIKNGLSVKVLTNSLASTDAVPVVAMYKKSRKKLLEEGIHLYEIRADAASRTEQAASSALDARLSLHAKMVVFDRKTVFVGTFNIDPRSEYLNTEVGLLVYSPELAEHVRALIESDMGPQNSYQLNWKGKTIEWVCEEENRRKVYTSDPHASPWLRFETWFLGLLPIQSQL